MSSPLTADSLRAQAAVIADGCQGAVIATAMERMRVQHRSMGGVSDCECSLCIALRPYVKARVEADRIGRATRQSWGKTDEYVADYIFRLEKARGDNEVAVQKAWEE